MTSLRWLLATLIFAALLLMGTLALLHHHTLPPSRPAHPAMTWQALLTAPAPPYVPEDLLEQLARQAGLPESPPSEPDRLFQALDALAQQVRQTPWAKNVTQVQQPTPGLRIEWVRVVPIAFLTEHSPQPTTVWLAGETLFWLTKLSQQDSAAPIQTLPVYLYRSRFPEPEPLTSLPQPIARAFMLSLALSPYRDTLSLTKFILGRDPVTLDIQVETRGGSYILWEILGDSRSNDVSDAEKINRLLDYVRAWQTLDKPAGPYFFDNRWPGSLLRQPIK